MPLLPAAYGGSQARGPIGAVAASLHHSHNNQGSKPRLPPTPQLSVMQDPWPTEQGQGSNLRPHGYESDLFPLHHCGNSRTWELLKLLLSRDNPQTSRSEEPRWEGGPASCPPEKLVSIESTPEVKRGGQREEAGLGQRCDWPAFCLCGHLTASHSIGENTGKPTRDNLKLQNGGFNRLSSSLIVKQTKRQGGRRMRTEGDGQASGTPGARPAGS